MKKTIAVIVVLIGIVTVSFRFIDQGTPTFENLQVLPKDTNKKQMDSVMKHFSVSLGINCNFCHIQTNDDKKDWDFASDKHRHKIIARDMMRMTMDLNKKYFPDDGGEAVTCYSCHNGKKKPESFPPVKK